MGIEGIYDILTEFIPAMFYDLAKFVAGYIIARLIYEGIFKEWRYGGWALIVKQGGEVLTRRKLSPQLAENIRKNDNDLSVYVKGVVSPHAWLSIDICSPESRQTGLLREDIQAKRITVDLDKNPSPKQPPVPPAQAAGPGQRSTSEA